MSGSSWVRRRSSTGVRSAPPPNHQFDVTIMRVFMCTAGTCGERGWTISEMPAAQKCGSSSAPAICRAKFGREFAVDRRDMDAGLLEQTTMQHRHLTAATFAALARPGFADEAAGLAVGHRSGAFVLECFEIGADVVAQGRGTRRRRALSYPRCRRSWHPPAVAGVLAEPRARDQRNENAARGHGRRLHGTRMTRSARPWGQAE